MIGKNPHYFINYTFHIDLLFLFCYHISDSIPNNKTNKGAFHVKKLKKTLVATTAVATTLALIAGCGTSGSSNTSNTSGPSGTGSATPASNEITVGTLYASSGAYATSSMPEYAGLKLWVDQVNAAGGVQVKATGKKEKIKLIAYNDQSSVSTATNLYNQLITQNKVNILVSDFGSVLTSVAVPIAQENKMLLFDPTGSGATFFTPNNPYIVLTALPTSQIWPDSLAQYLTNHGIKHPAILYCENDFDQSQNTTLMQKLQAAGITPVYDNGVATSTSNYSVLVHDIAAKNPDMVMELGYPNNDIAFLQALQSTGTKFNKTFVIFPGQLPALFEKDFPISQLSGLYTYPTPPFINYKNVNYGLTLPNFESQYKSSTGQTANFLSVAGYTTGLIVQKTLETSTSLSQQDLRAAVNQFSGTIVTLDGPFKVDSTTGAQLGETLPVGQLVSNGKGGLGVNILK
ncbi:amino acid ABC transporter substrate-binding protein [Alicyclobacillaceae bacterium I2511]|nr:amino acid ABC transporter substrate-binding protein [Alicyclobacillaceae bacterium I2511]